MYAASSTFFVNFKLTIHLDDTKKLEKVPKLTKLPYATVYELIMKIYYVRMYGYARLKVVKLSTWQTTDATAIIITEDTI